MAGLCSASPCLAQGWTDLESIPDSVLNRWGRLVADDNAWKSTSSYTNPLTDSTWTIDCDEVRDAVDSALSEDDFYWGTHPWYQGEHTNDHTIYLAPAQHAGDREIFETVMHESMHHDGQRHGRQGHWRQEQYIAIAGCHDYAKEEEDNEPTGNPVMPPEPVCEEKTRWVTKTKMVWVPKWEIEWRLEWDEVDEYGNVTHVRVGTRVDNGSWKEVSTPKLETYTECSN